MFGRNSFVIVHDLAGTLRNLEQCIGWVYSIHRTDESLVLGLEVCKE